VTHPLPVHERPVHPHEADTIEDTTLDSVSDGTPSMELPRNEIDLHDRSLCDTGARVDARITCTDSTLVRTSSGGLFRLTWRECEANERTNESE
jgi:hypothetical protein